MKRRILIILLVIASLLIMPVHASEQPRIIDRADLLTPEEEQLLEQDSLEFAASYHMDAVILTVDNLGGKDIASFADDYYDAGGYGVGTDHSGLILVVAMEERELYISTCGEAIARFSNAELDEIIENVSRALSAAEYWDAFQVFFGFAAIHHDADNLQNTRPVENGINWLMSVLIGAVVAGIAVLVMRSTMNTKKRQYSAGSYLLEGSYRLKTRQDVFLYSNVRKVKKEQNHSSHGGSGAHRSSSGRSHGGRGGKF